MAAEKRLIDADALGRFSFHIECEEDGETFERCVVDWDDIEDAPTVDAVEVVHGHWISLTDCSNAGVYCSICYKKVWKEDYAWCNRKNKLRSNYCPNCGAKMDGGLYAP